MCTANFNDAKAGENFDNFKTYANSKDGQAETAVIGNGLNNSINSYFQMKSNNAYLDYQRSIFLSNAKSLDRAALDVVESGRDQIAWIAQQGKMEQSAVTNDQAYRGIDTSVGSAKTHRLGLQKVNQINIENTRYNAMLQSFGIQSKALELRGQEEMAKAKKGNAWVGALMSLGQAALSVYAMGANGSGTGAKSGQSGK